MIRDIETYIKNFTETKAAGTKDAEQRGHTMTEYYHPGRLPRHIVSHCRTCNAHSILSIDQHTLAMQTRGTAHEKTCQEMNTPSGKSVAEILHDNSDTEQ